MFDLSVNAAAIVARLGAVEILGTVTYVDHKTQSLKYSVEMPAALVLLEKIGTRPGKIANVKAEAGWAVIVRGRALEGEDGVLAMVDVVADELHGFHTGGGILHFNGAEYFKEEAESVSYVVRFLASLTGETTNKPCQS